MGYTVQLTCQCGYQKELKLGTGRKLPDAAYIREVFPEDKLTGFNAALQAGCLGKLFYLENTLSYCNRCKEIKEGMALHYQVNGAEKTVYASCPDCGRELELPGDAPSCPKCGRLLSAEESGVWD